MLSTYQLSDILLDHSQAFVHITLNRPDALNAITLEMTRVLSIALEKATQDTGIKGLFISGAGGRAFCAGGDIKNLYKHGMAYRREEIAENVARIFFEEEYTLNRQVKEFAAQKPYVAYLNGITMGGGYGVSGHGSHIIATNKTKFAMPEVRIGFFPDIGCAYNFVRCEGGIGMYLALTGKSISGADMVYAGLADAFCDDERGGHIQAALSDTIKSSDEATLMDNVSDVLSHFHSSGAGEACSLKENHDAINRCFSKSSVAEIIAAVEKEDSDWGRDTLEHLRYASPTSLQVTFMQMQNARDMDFAAVMEQDFNLACHFIQGHDLYEGIKAAVIDKSKSPRWSPTEIDQINDKDVLKYFLPC